MAINYKKLPVYEQKDKILEVLEKNQVIVVQSPTGSGKTTQIPVILHEAGFSDSGIIAVTQPRRIAALSVSEFISKQLGTTYPGLVGYKMRFEDKTDSSTKIKIMTDGILLQEMKLDPWMSKYSVVMVDEAHERSLNIDFVLGLLKRVLQARPEFKVIVSSATMNAEAFSSYFGNCPIVNIDTITYPVSVIYDPPAIPASTSSPAASDALLNKIESTIQRVLSNKVNGDILIFLPGEKIIKDCMQKLYKSTFSRKIHIIPLYGRLAKEEQERVFDSAPLGKKKVIISTNIAETSVTIPGITVVIDSGLAKLNFYNPRTFTSSLIETPVSKASCNQRKGRAGRTQEGTCYRLYPRKDYETRQMYTLEEIFRTDLSEVVLRMSELGITEFEQFDFISPPGKEGIISAIETLNLLKALEKDNTLSEIGKLMVKFPLMPRLSRIIVEAILHYPQVLEETIIASAFLSAQSPFILPPGEEMEARIAHHAFRDVQGDFLTYVKLFKKFINQEKPEEFCEKNFLDYRVLSEIKNIKEQLELIVSDMGIPILNGGKNDDYLTCIASGMIQFIAVREGKENYKTLTADNIQIHPGSCMFKVAPLYIVAGEIVKTSRMFAMSVSPLTKENLRKISNDLESKLSGFRKNILADGKKSIFDDGTKKDLYKTKDENKSISENQIKLGSQIFNLRKIKGKKHIILPFEKLQTFIKEIDLQNWKNDSALKQASGLKTLTILNGCELLSGEKLSTILEIYETINFTILDESSWARHENYNLNENFNDFINSLDNILRIVIAKAKKKELGFICLFTDENNNYWYKVSRGIVTAVTETLNSLETLIEDIKKLEINKHTEIEEKINLIYRKLRELYEKI